MGGSYWVMATMTQPAAPPALQTTDPALGAYEPLAPFYDRFTEGYEYVRWLEAIEIWALAHGLRGRRVLDAACGTGKSFEPLLAKGYEVSACDLSPAMVAEARAKAAGRAEIVVADMRELPWRSQFDLITCLDDAVNYLLTPDDLDAALGSMAGALRPHGILAFDTNSLGTFRTTFAEEFEVAAGGTRFRWRGEGNLDAEPGEVSSATIEIDAEDGVLESRHVERHWSVAALRAACVRAGFRQVVFRGQVTGGRLVGEPDEIRHPKVMCLAVRSQPKGGGHMIIKS